MLADKTGATLPSGAKFSAAAREKLAKAHQTIPKLATILPARATTRTATTKMAAKRNCRRSGEGGRRRDLAKAEAVKIAAERDALQSGCKSWKPCPLPARHFLRAVAKGEDAGADDEPASKVAPVIDHRGDINEAATLIRDDRAGRARRQVIDFQQSGRVAAFSCCHSPPLRRLF